MSLVIDFSAIAEGVAGDARGSLTLVAVNPHLLVADQLPAQFRLALVVLVIDNDTEDPVILPGRTVTAQIEARGPDDEALFVAQMRQPALSPNQPFLAPRVQIIAQVPFTASKVGDYKISAHIAIVGQGQELKGDILATRHVQVLDSASMASLSQPKFSSIARVPPSSLHQESNHMGFRSEIPGRITTRNPSVAVQLGG